MARSQQRKHQVQQSFHASGTSTPRDLNQRLKILEIYTLYVLPRNQEWDYARQFIQMSEVLDDDRKEAFLQALQALQDEPKHEAQREEALKKQRQEQLEKARQREEEERKKAEEERKHREQSERRSEAVPSSRSISRSSARSIPDSRSSQSRKPPPSQPAKRPKPPPPTLYRRAILLILAAQQNLLRAGQSVWRRPMALFRIMLFVVALVLALARRDIRERVERTLKSSWEKVRKTVGMGMKVSYI